MTATVDTCTVHAQPTREETMTKKVVDAGGPKAGPYSPAVIAGGFCFVSGQVGFDANAGRLAAGGVEEEMRQAIANLASVLSAANLTLEDVVTTTIYVTDLSELQAVNKVFGESFGGRPPARSTVQVAALPIGASVEIEAVAATPLDSG
jgi:2-iminobutanoate/2-iminopropanoate deaminase